LPAGFAAAHLRHPFPGIHGPSALARATAARGGSFVIVEVVVPDKLFAGRDVAQGKQPDPAFDLIHLAIGIAGVVQICAQALAINHRLAVFQPIKIGAGNALVTPVGLLGRNAGAGVLDDTSSLADRGRGVDADSGNRRWTNA